MRAENKRRRLLCFHTFFFDSLLSRFFFVQAGGAVFFLYFFFFLLSLSHIVFWRVCFFPSSNLPKAPPSLPPSFPPFFTGTPALEDKYRLSFVCVLNWLVVS